MNVIRNIAIAIFLVAVSTPAWSASTKQEIQDLKDEVEALKEGQTGIQKSLDELKTMLQRGDPAAPAAAVFQEQEVSIGLSPYKGDLDAPVTMIEFSDFQCPFCSRHYRDVMPALVSEYVDTGKLKYVMRENPIASIHAHATNASLSALCANNQDKYWEMHNKLFGNQREFSVENFKKYAAEIGLDTDEFNACLDDKKYEPWVNADLKSASELGVRGTPGFILGLTDPEDPDKAQMTVYIKGAQPLENFKQSIDELLSKAGGEDGS